MIFAFQTQNLSIIDGFLIPILLKSLVVFRVLQPYHSTYILYVNKTIIKFSLKLNQQRTCDKNRSRILNIKHISYSLRDSKGVKIYFHKDIIEIMYAVN